MVLTEGIGSLSNEDDDGCENVAKKMNLRPFKFYLAYLGPLQLSNVGHLPGVEFLRTRSRYEKIRHHMPVKRSVYL